MRALWPPAASVSDDSQPPGQSGRVSIPDQLPSSASAFSNIIPLRTANIVRDGRMWQRWNARSAQGIAVLYHWLTPVPLTENCLGRLHNIRCTRCGLQLCQLCQDTHA